MNPFALDPTEQDNQLSTASMNAGDPSQTVHWYQGMGTGIYGGLKSAYYRDLFNVADQTNETDLRAKALDNLKSVQPDPSSVGLAGQVLFGLGDTLGSFYANVMGGNVTPQLAAMETAKSYTASQTELNVGNGMDRKTAANVASTEGIAVGLGGVMPVGLSGGLLTRIGSGAALNVTLGGAQRAITQQTLSSAGYEELAKQYSPFQASNILMDATIGGFFGGVFGHRGGEINTKIKPSDVDTVLTLNNAGHIELDTTPGIPADPAARAAHVEAFNIAMGQLLNDEPINVGDRITNENFIDNTGHDTTAVLTHDAVVAHLSDVDPDMLGLQSDLASRGRDTNTDLYSAINKVTHEEAATAAASEPVKYTNDPEANRAILAMKRGADKGELNRPAADLAIWLLQQNPKLGKDLSVRIGDPSNPDAAGSYQPMQKIATLAKENGKSAGDPHIAAHEILHHAERMLPDDLRTLIKKEHAKQLADLSKDPKLAPLIPILTKSANGDRGAYEAIIKGINDGQLPPEVYQFTSPSEFWATNAARILEGRSNPKLTARLKQYFSEMIEKIKGAFGYNSNAPIIRALDAAMKSDGTMTGKMLYDGGLFNSIKNEYNGIKGANDAGLSETRSGSNELQPGGRSGDPRVAEAQTVAEKAAGAIPKLRGLPDKPLLIDGKYYVAGPVEAAHTVAKRFMKAQGLEYNPPKAFLRVDPERAGRIASEFDSMVHNPNDPKVKASYDAMISETLAQWEAVKKSGLKIEFIKEGMDDPYATSPRMAIMDVVDNNHMWVFPTDFGFGSDVAALDLSDNPLLAKTGEVINGHEMRANDAFRIVHDYFGHILDGNGFRADGEENAWRAHIAMFSDKARPAVTTETRGKNSWVNYGPSAEHNATASASDTIYAPQKIGLLPDWVLTEGLADPAEAVTQPRPGVESPGVGVKAENFNGFEPALRVKVDTTGFDLPPKPLILTGTNNKNAARQIASIDDILTKFPDADQSPEAWSRMMAYAMATDDVPVPPYRFLKDINSDGALLGIERLNKGQIEDANHGFENSREFRTAYTDGTMDVTDTGKLLMWSFLSRGVSPYTQEGLFIDSFHGAGDWIKRAAEGNWSDTAKEIFDLGDEAKLTSIADAVFKGETESYIDAEKDALKKGKPFKMEKPTRIEWDRNPDGTVNMTYKQWAKTVSPKGSGQPGSGATHNLNAFGKLFLAKMGMRDENGMSRLQTMHDMMADPNMTGKEIRRWFMKNGEGVGIDNKVVSFTLLVAGFHDVMVLDRVQIRQLWDDGRFNGRNLYDGKKVGTKVVAGTALSDISYGARGLLIYEAIERALAKRVDNIYASVGRPEDASIGRYHWETWVADSQQEASHGTLDAVLQDAKGDTSKISEVTAKEGEYGAYQYGTRYGRDANGPYFIYKVGDGQEHRFTPEAFSNFIDAVKSPKNGVVPTKFKVKEAGNAPWYERPEVNRDKLDRLAAEYAGDGAPSKGGKALQEPGKGKAVPDSARSRGRDPYSVENVIAQRPDLAVPQEDGTTVPASKALAQADAEITTATHESQAYDVAAACALRG